MATKSYGRITATGAVLGSPGRLSGFYVNNTTAGTLVLWDNPTGATAPQISGTITPAIGWNPLPIDLKNGLWAVIGGTLDVTFCTE